MKEEICIADGIEADSLIGKIVYFEAKRVIKTGDTSARRSPKRRGGAKNPFYDVIHGTVVHATSTNVGIEAAGGLYNRCIPDVVLPEDLDRWMGDHPDKFVMRGDQ